MSDITAEKAALRKTLFARRREAHAQREALDGAANAHLLTALPAPEGKVIAGYRPIRTEPDPTPAMEALHRAGARLCVPVVLGEGLALEFREWSPGCAMVKGAFGAEIPAEGAALDPDIIIAPLLGWDRAGGRLGYGGGFYDRSIEKLRARKPLIIAGFAYSVQECNRIPREDVDQLMTLVITETEIIEVTF